jgi:myo-inositol-1-phosphate synthase
MPIDINCLDGGTGIGFIASGVVTGTEVIEANKKIYNRKNLLRLRYKIIDRTNCTEYRVTPEDIQVIAEQDKEAAKVNSNVVIALISPTAL